MAPRLSSLTRRRLFKLVGAFFLGQSLEITPARATVQPSRLERSAFATFLDILLPGDAYSGSASDLRVDQGLWDIASADPRFQQLVQFGCQWLNMTGSTPFAKLPAEQQTAVVAWMAESDWNQVPRRFYEIVRQLAVELYYSQSAARAGMPVLNPPQPLGYPPPWV